MKKEMILNLGGALLLTLAGATASGQAPVIGLFGQNGLLACTNLLPGSTANVEWAASALGPWTNTWTGLTVVTADSNGAIRVSVPMFYRVCGEAVPTNMALIPAGAFVMGDILNDSQNPTLGYPVHEVSVRALCIDRYEVTKALWDEVFNWATNCPAGLRYDFDNPGSFFSGALHSKGPDHPVHSVNWYDAVKWCNARSEKEGRTPSYYTTASQTAVYRSGQVDVQNEWVKWTTGYRLPTEAEWEKTARGGASGHRFPWSNVDTITHSQANYYSTNSYAYDISPTREYHPAFAVGEPIYTSPVGFFAANGYGLYDMAGNVDEWCWDWFDGLYYGSSPASDPLGPDSGMYRTARGGCWASITTYCRTARRNYAAPQSGASDVGFRTILPLPLP